MDVLLDPLQRQPLIEDSVVASPAVGGTRAQCLRAKVAQRSKAAVHSDQQHILGKEGPVGLAVGGGAVVKFASREVDEDGPQHVGSQRCQRNDVEEQAVLARAEGRWVVVEAAQSD